MATGYSITIEMSDETVRQLKSGSNGAASLYGFKAVRSGQGGGRPLVWFADADYLPRTKVTWTEKYEAYISTDQIISDGVISASTSKPADLGQTANVDKAGLMTVKQGGTPLAISINNDGDHPWTCGISQLQRGAMTPLCAFPLHGNFMNVMAPIEKVLLFFATETVKTATVVEKSYSKSVLLDLTANPDVKIKFDIDTGWDFGGAVWGKLLPANAELVPLLIVQDDALQVAG